MTEQTEPSEVTISGDVADEVYEILEAVVEHPYLNGARCRRQEPPTPTRSANALGAAPTVCPTTSFDSPPSARGTSDDRTPGPTRRSTMKE